MYDGHKIIVVTPAGRKRYLELLLPNILALRPIVDEYRLWVNTDDPSDIQYMQEIEQEHKPFVTLEYLPQGISCNASFTIHHFFKNTIDTNTIYVRFDDDVIFVDDAVAFENFIAFRIANPQYFLVYGNILNNAIISHLQQNAGNLTVHKTVSYNSMDAIGWKDPYFAELIHREVVERLKQDGNLKSFYINNHILHSYERVSINCISWLGSEFAKFAGVVNQDEENWLSAEKPSALNMPNVIFGQFCCVHYAFYTQRSHLDNTNILASYRNFYVFN